MVRYRLLGPLEVESETGRVDIGPPKRRAVLAALLLARGRVVSSDRLIHAAWGDDTPERSAASLQVHISTLRKALPSEPGVRTRLVRQSPGYFLEVDPEHIDVTVFEAGCMAARSAVSSGRWREAITASESALALWRGPLLDDLGDREWIRPEAARLAELHSECRESRITALLAMGRFADALNDVAQLRNADAYRERGCWLHMMALYRSGRSPEALDIFTAYSERLAEELGLDPGEDLRELQTAILRQTPELTRWPNSPVSSAPAETDASRTALTVDQTKQRIWLVGRHRETSAIADLLDDVRTGVSRWLILTGPAGIGKTRLAEEAAATVTSVDGEVIWLVCPDDRSTPSWWTMRQLTRALEGDLGEIFEHVDSDADTIRFQRYERLQALLEVPGKSPRLVVIDDVQWADSASKACLAYLAGAVRQTPVMFVVTVRDGEHSDNLELLLAAAARVNGNRRIKVPPLTTPEVAALAHQVAEELVTTTDATELTARTGGNPFFVLEYARLPRGEWGKLIPLAVRSLLKRRLTGLEPAVLEMLRCAAVLGEHVDTVTLARMTTWDLDSLAAHLDSAAHEHIIAASHTGEGFGFTHALLREEIIASMPALRLQRLHAAAAEILADSDADDALARRAQHLLTALPAVEPIVVVDACRKAAEEAELDGCSDSANRWWREARRTYRLLPADVRAQAQYAELNEQASCDAT